MFPGEGYGKIDLWRPGTGLFGLMTVPGHVFMFGFAAVVRMILSGVLHLSWRDSQKAEYLADLTGARLASTDEEAGDAEKINRKI